MVTRLTEQVCARINLKTDESLPKLSKVIVDNDILKSNFDRKCRYDAELQNQKEKSSSSETETFRKMTFTVSTMNNKLNFMKTVFNDDRIKRMNKQEEKLKLFEYEIENFKMNIENCATLDACFQIEQNLDSYAKKASVNELRDDIERKANREDIEIMISQN